MDSRQLGVQPLLACPRNFKVIQLLDIAEAGEFYIPAFFKGG